MALERAHAAWPERIDSLLSHPQVGNWLAYVERLWRGKVSGKAPAFVDFGAFHTLAVAAAAMAGHSLETKVPLRHGRVMIPCFGMARFSGCAEWDVATACVAHGRIWLKRGDVVIDVPPDPGTDGDGWWALREVVVGTEPRLRLWIDDLDPMRDLADPVDPVRLGGQEFEQWTRLLREAWAILCTGHPHLAEAMSIGLTSLAPLPLDPIWGIRSASAGEAFGALLCSRPVDAVSLAETLVHEFMHIQLGGLMHLVQLTTDHPSEHYYAPWRDDPRPIGGLLQGIYAFAGVADFRRQHRHTATGRTRSLADFEYWLARTRLRLGLRQPRAAVELSGYGRVLLDTLTAEAESWCDDTVPHDVAELVRLVTAGHRIGWLLRNHEPRDEDIRALAAAWGSVPTTPIVVAPSTVRTDSPPEHWSHPWVGLARRRIEAPDRLADARDELWGKGLTRSEVDLFSDDRPGARQTLLEHDPGDDVMAWTVLCTAVAMDSPECAGNALIVTRPEVVRALYRRLPPDDRPSPLAVAAWITDVANLVEPGPYRL